jgi:hypothetical protein
MNLDIAEESPHELGGFNAEFPAAMEPVAV